MHKNTKMGIKFILGVLVTLELGVIFLFSPLFPAKLEYLSAILPSVLVSHTNETRSDLNIPILTTSEKLEQAAQLKVNDMAKRGYFSHISPEGQQPWYFLDLVDYQYDAAGENLAVNFVDSNDVHRAWMKSPTHKKNIVQTKFTEIGIATAEGKYKGKDVIFVVQFFGTPKPVAVSSRSPQGTISQASVIQDVSEIEISEEPQVMGEQTEVSVEPLIKDINSRKNVSYNLFENVVYMPKSTINTLMYILLGIIAIVLSVFLTFRMHIKKQDIFIHGLLLFVIFTSMIFINRELTEYFGII